MPLLALLSCSQRCAISGLGQHAFGKIKAFLQLCDLRGLIRLRALRVFHCSSELLHVVLELSEFGCRGSMPLPRRCYCVHDLRYGDSGHCQCGEAYYVFRRHSLLPSCVAPLRSEHRSSFTPTGSLISDSFMHWLSGMS
jgi:hypothetical protein